MELYNILLKLDESSLTREVTNLQHIDRLGISYRNTKSNSRIVTVNGETYTDLIKICLIPKEESVKLYINNISPFKLTNIDTEDVSTFSVS